MQNRSIPSPMHSSHSIDDIVGVTVDALKIRHTTVKASLSAIFIDEHFNIFQKVYLETETSLKKEAPRQFYFPATPKAKIAELEKIGG